MSKDIQNKVLFQQVVELLQNARQQVLRTVNSTMTYTYFEIGRMIVEEEQIGKERAEYGKQLLKGLSKELTNEFGKGFSVDNLQNMRAFFMSYSKYESLTRILQIQNSESMSRNFDNANSSSLTTNFESQKAQSLISFFKLTWTHYVF